MQVSTLCTMCRLTGSLCLVVSLLALACVGVLAEEQSSNDAAMAGVSAPSYAGAVAKLQSCAVQGKATTL
jgi:hypothetical protein